MKPEALKRAIDRMVEDAIRRILPNVMNEVLLRTIASSGVVTERAPAPVRPAQGRKSTRPPQRPVGKRKVELSELLDPTAGADFYEDPRDAYRQSVVEESFEQEEDAEEAPPPVAKRLSNLPPALQGLVEGMDLDDDGEGEMWGDESDSNPLVESRDPGIVGDPTPIRDVGRAAKAVGIDFNRMKGVIAQTSAKPKVDREDARAQAQFEQLRLKRMREQLNGGKPVE